MSLEVLDYAIFGAVLIISGSIGLYYNFTGGKQKTVKEYLLANNQMSAYPVAFSLMASFMSAVTLLGVSSENYVYGTQFQIINFSYIIGTVVVNNVYLPVFYQLQFTSVYEYLEKRFGKIARMTASIAFSLQMILYMGIVLYAPSLALSAVTGISKVLAILSIGLCCTFYSAIGGMKAVLITDVFQSLLMFVACYCVIIKGIVSMGFDGILKAASDGDRIQFLELDLDPTVRHTVWSQLFGGMFIFLSIYAVNQAQVQRLLTVKDLKQSQYSMWISLPILIFLSFSTAFAGLTVYARYKGCDPLKEGRICSPDQLLPFYVIDNLSEYPGISGLFIGGILSGSLSTVSSAINSLAAVTWSDYFQLCVNTERMSSFKVALINKFLAAFYGLLCIGLAFLAEKFSGVLQASLTIFGVVGGPLLGLFTLGMIFPFASEKPSVVSFLLALGFGLWIGFGGPKPPVKKLSSSTEFCDPNFVQINTCKNSTSSAFSEDSEYFYLYRISYMWYTLIGFSITIILGSLLSLRFPETKLIDPKLLSPILNKIIKRSKSLNEESELEECSKSNTNVQAINDNSSIL